MSNKVITDHGHWTNEFFRSTKDILREDDLKIVLTELGTVEDVLCACAEICGIVHAITNEVIIGLSLKEYNNGS